MAKKLINTLVIRQFRDFVNLKIEAIRSQIFRDMGARVRWLLGEMTIRPVSLS